MLGGDVALVGHARLAEVYLIVYHARQQVLAFRIQHPGLAVGVDVMAYLLDALTAEQHILNLI
ncbi:hypothetical protein GCM10022394_09690 [Zobellella aerophila]|uniref:Uncharacterized protein n=1 Tax=Zobellella aerophila TaxID=870480 RepID=A0ABP6VCK9_9GAMM